MLRKRLLVLASLSLLLLPAALAKGGSTYVKGYFRKNGTYVSPHYRSAPDGNAFNNWSTIGNVNPYTGKEGTRDPYSSGSLHAGSGDASNLVDPSAYNAPSYGSPGSNRQPYPPYSSPGAPGYTPPGTPYGYSPGGTNPYTPSPTSSPQGMPNQYPNPNLNPSPAPGSDQSAPQQNPGQEDKLVLEVMNADTTSNTALAQYVSELKKRIERQWMPNPVRSFKKCLVYFEIGSKNEVQKLRISSSSGDREFDEDVAKAVEDAGQAFRAPAGQNIAIVAFFKSVRVSGQ